jgi:glucose/arabinose dehydrogenase
MRDQRASGRALPLCLVAALSLLAAASLASPAEALNVRGVARFHQPVYVTAAPGDRLDLFVVERAGRIMVVRRGRKLHRPFLDIRRLVDLRFPRNQFRDQGGLVSLAFAPDYRRSGRFYVFYTHRAGTVVVDEFRRSRRSAPLASAASRRNLISVPRHGKRTDLGGHVAFGPDGLLYAGFGYGRDPFSAQDPAAPTGKILRLDPSSPESVAHPQVFASGLRMPWRFSFDPPTGDLIVGDVGEQQFEEVDVLGPTDAGANLGWPYFEAFHRHQPGGTAGLTFPVLSKPHKHGFCAIVGGYVVRGRRLPALRGRYLYGDVCTGRVRSAKLASPRASSDRSEHLTVPYLVSFGRDARGRLYAVSLDGPVYRVAP